jgi:hypothetical protein
MDLDVLKGGGDFSLENGDLAMTKDGDIKLGDSVHNTLFRLVHAWRLNAPRLSFSFGQVRSMLTAGEAEFIAAFHEASQVQE